MLEHRDVDVGKHDAAAFTDNAGELAREVTCAACEVQDDVPGPRIRVLGLLGMGAIGVVIYSRIAGLEFAQD